MNFLRGRPKTAAAAAVGFVMLIAAWLVVHRIPVSSDNQLYTWAGLNSVQSSDTGVKAAAPQAKLQMTSGTDASALLVPIDWQNSGDSTTNDSDPLFLLKQIVASSSSGGKSSVSGVQLDNLYSYIPRGLVSLDSGLPHRTVRQEAMYEYGNQAGTPIAAYGDTHRDQANILKDFLADRTNQMKKDAVMRLASDLSGVGIELLQLPNIPSDVTALNQNLAQGYIDLGKKLATLPSINSDADLVTFVKDYDARADQFNKAYIALVSLFEISGVQFSSSDSGRVFMFSQ